MKYANITLALSIITVHTIYPMENKGKELTVKTLSCEPTKSQVENVYSGIGKTNTQELIKTNQRPEHTLTEQKQQKSNSCFKKTLACGVVTLVLLFAVGSRMYATYMYTPKNESCFNVCNKNYNNCHTLCVDNNNSCTNEMVSQLMKHFNDNETLHFARSNK